MIRFLKKLALFLTPFIFYVALVIVIDPYFYFRSRVESEDSFHASVARQIFQPLWKLRQFEINPSAQIALGDSRMHSLGDELRAEPSGERISNLSYGGGSLSEAIKTFYWVADRVKLHSVTIGINLDTYNQANAKDRVTSATTILESSSLYVSDRLVGWTLLCHLAHHTWGYTPKIGTPDLLLDQFWNYQLDVTAQIAYGGYREPLEYRRELEKLSAYCKQEKIALQFVIFPEHSDLQRRASETGLDAALQRMRSDLGSLGRLHDFSTRTEWTSRRELFIDPYHFVAQVGDQIKEEVWIGPRDDRFNAH